MGMTIDNLCNSCINIGCEFQSGIVRTKCAFYMPPQLEPDNCGNYIIQDSTTKNDLGVDCISRQAVLDLWHLRLNDKEIYKAIYDMPSVTPQEPMVEIDLYSVIKQKYIEREVLEKIRTEIDNINLNKVAAKYKDRFYGFQREVIKIIDKYKAESEDKEN